MMYEEQNKKWFADKGDLTHRINYDLNENSLVLDIGGYLGNWASDIYSKYLCNINIYEPVKSYYDFIVSRFSKNPKIHPFNCGFSNVEKTEIMKVSNEGSSIFSDFKKADSLEIIVLRNFNEFLNEFQSVDLIKINIEGSEYDILESISDENLAKLKNIQVQFHLFADNCVSRRDKIHERLTVTHCCTYNYDFVWENWKFK